MRKLQLAFLLFISIAVNNSIAQESDENAMIYDFKGLQFKAPDSSFYINFRFRMQNRLGAYTTSGDDLGIEEYEARVRRLRMRVDGYLYNPKLAYSIQLSFSRGDQDFEDSGVANIIRDAVIFYNFSPKFYMAFGLNKLPGNRQRVNSSGQLQFADRSIVNAAMNIDRDFGIKAYYNNKIGGLSYNLKGAITTGEGRSANTTDDGLAYTGRAELLPFGDFTGEGDYSEGDLEREPTPKLSLAGGYSYNRKTTRSGGQTGEILYSPVNLGTWIFDAIFKYNGWAYAAEFLKRDAANPLTYNADNDLRYAFTGKGTNHQLSYVFKSDYELAFRYSWLAPSEKIRFIEDKNEVLELGATKYIRNHRIKVQLNLNYQATNSRYNFSAPGNRWGILTQFELGI